MAKLSWMLSSFTYSGNKVRISVLTSLMQHSTGNSSQCNKGENGNKRPKTVGEENCSHCRWPHCKENHKEYRKNRDNKWI